MRPIRTSTANYEEHRWTIAQEKINRNITDSYPALKGVDIPKTGRIGPIGTLTTTTLVISGESGFSKNPAGQRGAKLFAYDNADPAAEPAAESAAEPALPSA